MTQRPTRESDEDLGRRYDEYKWRQLLNGIELVGDPTKAQLALMIRRHGVPEIAREYVIAAMKLEGGRRGRKKEPRLGPALPESAYTDPDPDALFDAIRAKHSQSSALRAANLTWLVHAHRAAFRIQGLSQPKTRALSAVASAKHMSSDTLRDKLRRDLPPEWKAMGRYAPDVFEPIVHEMVSSGRAKLDRVHGLKWSETQPDPR